MSGEFLVFVSAQNSSYDVFMSPTVGEYIYSMLNKKW